MKKLKWMIASTPVVVWISCRVDQVRKLRTLLRRDEVDELRTFWRRDSWVEVSKVVAHGVDGRFSGGAVSMSLVMGVPVKSWFEKISGETKPMSSNNPLSSFSQQVSGHYYHTLASSGHTGPSPLAPAPREKCTFLKSPTSQTNLDIENLLCSCNKFYASLDRCVAENAPM